VSLTLSNIKDINIMGFTRPVISSSSHVVANIIVMGDLQYGR
jgi:hypothetical protein